MTKFTGVTMWARWHKYRIQARAWLAHSDQDALAARCAFYLNRQVRRGPRSPFVQYFYALKNRLVEHFYESGFCEHVSLRVQEMGCWGASHWQDCGLDCPKCGGTGVYGTHYLYKFVFNVSGRTYVWHQPTNLVNIDVGMVEMGGKYEARDGGREVELNSEIRELYYCVLYEYLQARGLTDGLYQTARPGLWRGIRRDARVWWLNWGWRRRLYRRTKRLREFADAVGRFYRTGQWEIVDEIPF